MPTNYVDAEDTILGMLKTAWDASAPALFTPPYTPALVYESQEADLKPHPRDGSKAWARAVVRTADGRSAAIGKAPTGLARFRRFGIAWVQIFVPAKFASGWTQASQLASIAQQAYEGKAGHVTFTRVQLVDLPQDGNWVRKDVKAFYSWDELHT
jgi:hypothetical protein